MDLNYKIERINKTSFLAPYKREVKDQKNTKMKRFERLQKVLLSIVMLTYFGSHVELSSQCSFNCVDTLNVSVNNLCQATITPNMVLKGFDPLATCVYGIELMDENGTIINLDESRADIGPQFVGSFLQVRIFEANVSNPNSCWSVVNIEDKLPPDIVCLGTDTIPCFGNDPFEDEASAIEFLENAIEEDLIDNCGNEEVTINITRNELTRMICSDEFAARRIVGYNVLDNISNITTCEDTIYYERIPLDSLDAPKNFGDDMPIDCNDPFPSVSYLESIDSETPGNNSMPNFDGESIVDLIDSTFVERGLCNFKLTTSDLMFPTCGSTFKLVRRWTVIDWCDSGNLRIFNQVIKVVDEEINLNPISNLGPFDTEKELCSVDVELPFPQVAEDECHSWTYVIGIREPGETLFTQFGEVRDTMPQVVTRRFSLGVTTIRYTVTDECGNIDEEEFDVTIEDGKAPIPVCDSRTVVTLNENFLGKVFARSFDDGSYDACTSIVLYQVRRVDRATTSCETPQDFDDFVKFCCADVGQSVMVELQITDETGLTSTCMTEAVVQFNGEGPSVVCPPDVQVQDCTNFDSFDITGLTAPTITSPNPCIQGALTPLIREVGRTIDDCGDGYIDVEWFLNFTGADDVICTQRITFTNTNIFTADNVNFPADRVVDTCDDAPPTQAELDALIEVVPGCNNVFASEPFDRVVENVPGVCRRIIRTWTVVDWCRFPANPDARFTFDQIVDVVNNSGPVIDVSGSNLTLEPKPDSCRAHLLIEGIATDDCSLASNITWTHSLSLISNGEEILLLSERPGRILERRIDAGNFVVTWTATDECGNTSTERQLFSVDDDIAPVAQCGFAIAELGADGSVIITAAELDNGSSDNCSGQTTFAIRREGASDTPSPQLTFTCSDVGVNTVELWVTDFFGNQDVCLASVDIRGLEADCANGVSAFSIAGNIHTIDDISVESAEVVLNAENVAIGSEMTELDGQYAFDDLVDTESYDLEAHKNDDHLNGVSTLDIILIQRHILGLQSLDSPYKLIAADVNVNGAVSAVDLVVLRRLILGQIEELPDTESWKFISEGYHFSDPTSPWPLEEGAHLGQVDQPMTQDLIAIKMGDINGNAIANTGFASTRSTKEFEVSSRSRIENGRLVYELIANEYIEAYGYQLALEYDAQALVTKDVRSNHMLIVDDMLSDKGGNLSISLAGSSLIEYQKDDVVLEVTFALSESPSSQEGIVRLSNKVMSNEIYNEDYEVHTIRTVAEDVAQEVILHQNRPNPFEDETLIDFEIPNRDQVTFELFDINGMRVYSRSNNYPAGKHQIKVSSQEIGLNKGIYYYQIHTQQRSLIRKMIIL